MPHKQHSISLPESASAILEGLPRGEKSQMVAEALFLLKKEQSRIEALNILDSIEATEWDTDKDAVQLVDEARQKRSGQILGNINE